MCKYFITTFKCGNKKRADGCHSGSVENCFCLKCFPVFFKSIRFHGYNLEFSFVHGWIAPTCINVAFLFARKSPHALFSLIINVSRRCIDGCKVRIHRIFNMSAMHRERREAFEFFLTHIAHFTHVAPHVNPPPKAANTMLSPLFNLLWKSHKQSGIVAAVVFP